MLDGRAKEWLDAGGFFEWGGLQIFHAEFGDPDAPPLLLLHGFPTSSIDWYDVVEPLGRERRVCLLDFPGFGFSDKPTGESYTIDRDCELVDHYLGAVVGTKAGAVVAHDRGDSVALAFAARCASHETEFELDHLVLSNGNMFLPLSNLNVFQHLVLDPATAPEVLAAATPEALAAGMGQSTFTPPRAEDDPAIAALAQTFAHNDGIAVLHDTIQYLVERSEHEQRWLEALARSPAPTTIVWGLYDVVSPLRVAAHIWDAYLATNADGNEFWVLPRANHYLQNDQPQEFAAVVLTVLSHASPDAPGPLAGEPGAPILIDRSRTELPAAKDVLASERSSR
jgi:pimeloyl-ACP methyl ester carboxylesterase